MKLLSLTIILKLIVSYTYLFHYQYNKTEEVEIIYMANEGVFIKTKNTKILIDTLFDKEFDFLDVLSLSERKKIENANAEYKSIDAILATHLHGDHFNAQLVGNHLLNNYNALFFGPSETIKNFEKYFEDFNSIKSRVKSIVLNLYESQTITIKNAKIKVLRLEHLGNTPWNEAENVAYLITINGKNIIHFGDSKIDVTNLEKFNLAAENIDVAIISYWQLITEQQINIIKEHINPRQILVAHIPLAAFNNAQKEINELGYNNIKILTKHFEVITVN